MLWNAKLTQQSFWPNHDKLLAKTIPTSQPLGKFPVSFPLLFSAEQNKWSRQYTQLWSVKKAHYKQYSWLWFVILHNPNSTMIFPYYKKNLYDTYSEMNTSPTTTTQLMPLVFITQIPAYYQEFCQHMAQHNPNSTHISL